MSCALWRLHESIDRNDANELFLLSIQSEARRIAENLNIIVRSAKDLEVMITAMSKRPDLEIFGDVERELGVAQKVAKDTTSSNEEHHEIANPIGEDDNLHTEGEKSAEETTKSQSPASSDAGRSKIPPSIVDNVSPEDANAADKNGNRHTTILAEESKTLGENNSSKEHTFKKSGEHHGVPEDGLAFKSDNRAISESPKIATADVSLTETVLPRESAANVNPPVFTPPEHQGAKSVSLEVSEVKEASSRTATQAFKEPEDSDEEVVVFVPQPKRFSAQKKLAHQSSRPSTPNTQIHTPKQLQKQQAIADQSSEPSTSVGNLQAPLQVEVPTLPKAKQAGRGRKPTAGHGSHGQSQPSASPTVIDPDAFGRSFAVNPNRSPRTVDHRLHHRPRPSLENTQLTLKPQGNHQNGIRTSSPNANHRRHSPRLSSNLTTKDHEFADSVINGVQHASPQNKLHDSNTGKTLKDTRKADVAPIVIAKSMALSASVADAGEPISRKAFPEAQLDPIGTPPKRVASIQPTSVNGHPKIQGRPKPSESGSNTSDDLTPRNSISASRSHVQKAEGHSNPQSSVSATKPKRHLAEANEFIPRGVMSTQLKPQTAEVESFESRSAMQAREKSPIFNINESMPPKLMSPPGQMQQAETDDFVRRSVMTRDKSPKASIQRPASGSGTLLQEKGEQAETNGLLPKNAMPARTRVRTPDPYHIEPRASMPDVQYVLKSGSTRAATRGKGRLWQP